jgi:hypothetical protein
MSFPLGKDEWWFCREPNCPYVDRIHELQGRLLAHLWLEQFKGDPLKMQMLRSLVQNEMFLSPTRASDDALLKHIAALLISGRMHLHERRWEIRDVGGATQGDGQLVPFPLAERRAPREVPPPPPMIEAASFSSDVDLPAQAAALVAAAAQGTPFCPV